MCALKKIDHLSMHLKLQWLLALSVCCNQGKNIEYSIAVIGLKQIFDYSAIFVLGNIQIQFLGIQIFVSK